MLPSDKPDDAIIENDAELDKWYENFLREQARKMGKKKQAAPELLSQVHQFGADDS